MADGQTRVRWNEGEKNTLAAEMARLREVEPTLSPLDAVLAAQVAFPQTRRRDVKAWSIVEPLVGRRLACPR